ncbi:MAG: hypothetical protein EZS28_008395 [Streblomastix strix]|uniref:Uncharacterized protein n=1 Tax=Streblomastix strix TaxID=222440 RepID=A0A5J4WPG3_9EUKA|nr:MAG: hypothetical protein EZS28_008395 [Streblomastix strix]
MIHPGIGGAIGAGANLAGAVDRLKRGGLSGGMMPNEEYQLFIDNNNALVYAINNQIVDGMASYYALKIEPNGGEILPDQVTLASDATPLSVGTVTAGISNEYSRRDHVHPFNIITTIPPSDSANGSVETKASSIPIVNSADDNGTSAFYARQDHVHTQQLTYDGNVTATKFITACGLAIEILCANGVAINGVVDVDTDQTINGIKTFGKLLQVIPTVNGIFNESIKIGRHQNNQWSNVQFGSDLNSNPLGFVIEKAGQEGQADKRFHISTDGSTLTFNGNGFVDVTTDQTISGIKTFASVMQIQPNSYNFNEGLIISRSTNGNYSGIYLGCNPSFTYGTLTDQWSMVNTPTGELRIGVGEQFINNNQRLMLSADQQQLFFNGNTQLNPNSLPQADGLRARRENNNGYCFIMLGCDKTQTTGAVDHQWKICTPASSNIFPFGLVITLSYDVDNANREL